MLRGRSGEETDDVWRVELLQWFDKIFSHKIFSAISNTGIEYCLHNRISLVINNIKGYATITHSQLRKIRSD